MTPKTDSHPKTPTKDGFPGERDVCGCKREEKAVGWSAQGLKGERVNGLSDGVAMLRQRRASGGNVASGNAVSQGFPKAARRKSSAPSAAALIFSMRGYVLES